MRSGLILPFLQNQTFFIHFLTIKQTGSVTQESPKEVTNLLSALLHIKFIFIQVLFFVLNIRLNKRTKRNFSLKILQVLKKIYNLAQFKFGNINV